MSGQKKRRPWTAMDDAAVVNGRRRRMGWAIIGDVLKRTGAAVRQRWYAVTDASAKLPPRPRRLFSAAEDEQLLALRAAGKRWSEVGAIMGRDDSSLSVRWHKIAGVPNPSLYPLMHHQAAATTRRRCLCCRNEFESTGPGNRLCRLCSKAANGYAPAIVGTSAGAAPRTL